MKKTREWEKSEVNEKQKKNQLWNVLRWKEFQFKFYLNMQNLQILGQGAKQSWVSILSSLVDCQLTLEINCGLVLNLNQPYQKNMKKQKCNIILSLKREEKEKTEGKINNKYDFESIVKDGMMSGSIVKICAEVKKEMAG